MAVTKEDIFSIPVFKFTFESDKYKPILTDFLNLINRGSEIPNTEIIRALLSEYINNIGISKGYRTVFYDFAWAVLENSPELWNDKEKQSGASQLDVHITDYFPDFQESDNDDVAILTEDEYLDIGFDILEEGEMDNKLRSGFCYAMYVFIKRWDFE